MIETWNDYEEGSAIETGIPGCDGNRHRVSEEEGAQLRRQAKPSSSEERATIICICFAMREPIGEKDRDASASPRLSSGSASA